MNLILKYNLSFFLVLISISVISQDLYYEHFTGADGLPSMTTYEMVQDSNGLLWIGTENGLVSYDGERFQRYTHPDLLDNDIFEIAVDKSGCIYFLNLYGQLGYVENEKVHIIDHDTIPGRIYDMAFSREGNYIVSGRENGSESSYNFRELTRSDEGKHLFEKINIEYLLSKNGELQPCSYEREPRTLLCRDDKRYLQVTPFRKIYCSLSGPCYYFDENRIVFEIDRSIIGLDSTLSINRIVTFNNTHFVFPSKGVLINKYSSPKIYSILNSIQANTAFVDRENNTWISTPNDGLYKFPSLDFQFKNRDNSFVSEHGINDFIVEENGDIYLATTAGQVLTYSKERKLLKEATISLDVKEITFESSENYIIGSGGRSLFRINKQTKEVEIQRHSRDGLKCLVGVGDSIIAGTRGGLAKFKFDDFQKNAMGDIMELKGKWINTLYRDPQKNRIYIGTNSGLYLQENGNDYERIILDGGSDISVSSIVAGQNNSVWIGTRIAGALLIKGDTILERFNTANGLKSNNVNDMKISGEQLIVSTTDGVSIKNLGTGEVKSMDDLGGVLPKEILTCDLVDGEYWLGSNSGLTIVNPDLLNHFKKQGLQLSVKSIYANGIEVAYKDNMEFSYEVNSILINFRNVSLRKGSNKAIKYRISQNDTAWVYSTDPLIRLQALKYGNYQVEAIGVSDGIDEGSKIELAFSISPPWWQTWWARTLGSILIILVLRVFAIRRTKRIRLEESVKRDYLTQINKIKDQALQLQMNPHFIFNSLNAIQGFIGTDEEEMAMNYLARFARLIRLIFEHSKGNTITLDEEMEFINLYLDLEKLRFKGKVNVDISFDEELEQCKDLIHVPPLLIQPIIENSFKHGLFHKKGKGNLRVDYTLIGEMLQVVVKDDGIGRVEANKISQKNTEKHVSSGIKTTQERISLLNFERNHQRNTIQIEDMYNEDGSPAGTKTTLKLVVQP